MVAGGMKALGHGGRRELQTLNSDAYSGYVTTHSAGQMS